MRQQNFFSNPYLRLLGIPAAAVTVMTLILSQGNFIAAIGAGIGTVASSYVINRRLLTKLKFLEEELKTLEGELESLEQGLRDF